MREGLRRSSPKSRSHPDCGEEEHGAEDEGRPLRVEADADHEREREEEERREHVENRGSGQDGVQTALLAVDGLCGKVREGERR